MELDITSRQNNKIKQVRALRQHKQRQAEGLFVVEGLRHVGEAVEAGAPVEYILYAPEQLHGEYAERLLAEIRQRDLPLYTASAEVMDSVTEKENPQGILAVAQQRLTPLEQLSPANFPWGVAVVAPQDPGNVGTMLRSIDAVGASGLVLLEGGVDIFHPGAVRASMGVLFRLPVCTADFETFNGWQKKWDFNLYGSSARGDTPYDQVQYQQPAILLLGSERQGLTESQRQACRWVVQLPMLGNSTSLNLSVAAGVLLYAMLAKFK
jgi:TrmH family RNA methyltransferase